MADQHDKSVPNRAANMEQAEGSRDNATEPNAAGKSGGSPGGPPARTPERASEKPFVTAADPADEDKNVTHEANDKSRR